MDGNQNTSNDLTTEELDELKNLLGMGASIPEGKYNAHSFLHNVATAEDTTKLGNLSEIEIGNPKYPLRTCKELALFCKAHEMEYFGNYFTELGEITTSTSLSKDAKLIGLAVITRRQLEDVTEKPKKENRGFFKKKEVNKDSII